MSKSEDNKSIVGRWFTQFWGERYNPGVVDELAAPDMLLQYSLHAPRRGRENIKAFMADFRAAFPDLNFSGVADLIAEGEYVVGREAAHTPARHSAIFSSVLCLPRQDAKCTSREPRCFESKTARSRRKWGWMMA
jgi:hypothetical protein